MNYTTYLNAVTSIMIKRVLGEDYCVRQNAMKYKNLMNKCCEIFCQLKKLIVYVACSHYIETTYFMYTYFHYEMQLILYQISLFFCELCGLLLDYLYKVYICFCFRSTLWPKTNKWIWNLDLSLLCYYQSW